MDINTAQHSTVITFSNYHEGSAPALIMNHTQWDVLTYKQRYEKRLCEKLNFLLSLVHGPFWKMLEFHIPDVFKL